MDSLTRNEKLLVALVVILALALPAVSWYSMHSGFNMAAEAFRAMGCSI